MFIAKILIRHYLSSIEDYTLSFLLISTSNLISRNIYNMIIYVLYQL